MPAYILVQVTVRDPVIYAQYKELAPASISGLRGAVPWCGAARWTRWKANGHPPASSCWSFPTSRPPKRGEESAEYAPALRLRQLSADTEMILVDGVPTQASPIA